MKTLIADQNTLPKNNSLRILLIGDFSGDGDEGLTQISKIFLNLLSVEHNVQYYNTKKVLFLKNLLQIWKFQPQIIHYITGPTLKSFFVLMFLKIILMWKVKTIISATRPFIPSKYFFLLKYFHVDLIFTQSSKWENIFNKYGFKTSFLPNPINTEKFNRSKLSKDELKLKYNIPPDYKILLHVGHIRPNRNLNFFLKIKEDVEKLGYKILIVSSTHFEKDESLHKELLNSGIIVIKEYLENINEIYSLSDYLVFPIKGLESNYFPQSLEEIGVIDMPLSILEALSIGIPIISNEVDSINNLYKNIHEKCTITFWNGTKSDFLEKLKNVKMITNNNSALRKEVEQYTIKEKIQVIYSDLLNSKE